MIFIHDKIYAKVWKVTKSDKYIDLQITTSEKDADGNYINSGWFPRLIGHAFNSLKDKIKEGDRIAITKSKITNERRKLDDGTTRSSFRFVVLEANIESAKSEETTEIETPTSTQEQQASSGEACPW